MGPSLQKALAPTRPPPKCTPSVFSSVFGTLHRAVPVMPVMAEIGVMKTSSASSTRAASAPLVEIDHVLGAFAAIDQRMEVDEGIVARGVLIAPR